MATGLLEYPQHMAKPKTLSVKLHMEVIESARIVAAYRGEQISDMLSEILKPILAKMEQEEIAKRSKPRKAKPD
jgi:hypothetical protein